jgi:hypothetical protein
MAFDYAARGSSSMDRNGITWAHWFPTSDELGELELAGISCFSREQRNEE